MSYQYDSPEYDFRDLYDNDQADYALSNALDSQAWEHESQDAVDHFAEDVTEVSDDVEPYGVSVFAPDGTEPPF